MSDVNWNRPTVAVVGAGAVGAYYGGRLAEHGIETHFLLRSEYDVVKRNGWTIQSCHGDFQLSADALHVFNDVAQMPQVDLVLVACKTTSNDALPDLVKPLMHAGSAVLTLQNGLGNEQLLAEHVGAERVLGGLAFVCINRIRPGLVHHIDHGLVAIGEFGAAGVSPRLEALGKLMSDSKIRIRPLEDLNVGRWEKLLWNVPFSGLGTALDLASDRLIATAHGEQRVRAIMQEVLDAAKALNIHVDPSAAERQMQATRSMGPYKSSMQIDRQVGRAMEYESIVGAPLRAGESAGVSMPQTRWIYEALCLLAGAEPV